MARIVPARPKMIEDMSEVALTELELLLNDEYVIFQNFPLEGSLLVCKLNDSPFVVMPMPDVKWIDFDTNNFVTRTNNFISYTEKAMDVKHALELAKLPPLIPIIYYSPKFKPENPVIRSNGTRSELRFAKTTEQILNKIQLLSSDVSCDDFLITNAINEVTPGGMSFEPGKITDSQLDWRNSRPTRSRDSLISELKQQSEPPVTKKNRLDNVKLKDGEGKLNALDTVLDETLEEASTQEYKEAKVHETKVLSISSGKKVTPFPKAEGRVSYLEAMVAKCLDNIASGKSIYSSGVEVEPSFISSATSLLPAVLVAASEYWAPVVSKKGGKGGFDIRLETDKEALLGFKVVDVMPSAPMVLFMPINHLFRKTIIKDELIMDDIVSIFARWVSKYNLDDSELEEIDLKIALKAIED